MKEANQLAVVEPQTLAIQSQQPAPNVADMLQAVIKGGVSNENVAALEKLVGLYERMQDRDAEKAFASAFVALQSEMKGITANKPVPGNDGSVRYKFAPYEEIMAKVSPLLQKHGFTVTFSTDFKEGRLLKICTLQHIGGHSRSNQFAVRIGSGPPKASESQADGAASTYAKRFALCDALNIVIDKDVDAAAEGDTQAVTPEQSDELERRVKETNSNIPAFLKFAGAHSFAEIKANRYDDLDSMLRKKEQAGR